MSIVLRELKKAVTVFCILIFTIVCTSCKLLDDKVVDSLGEYDNYVFYSEGGPQDYTDYAKYYYTSANIFGNRYFTKIEDYNLDNINEHLDDFEGWIETIKRNDASCEIVTKYDFNRKIIDMEDYIYIYSEEHTWDDGFTSLVNYDIYFFDVQTLVLYYFHNNI